MGQEPNITAACNLDCNCEAAFDPVCGVDNIMYYTACHAGCHVEVESEGKSVSNCRETFVIGTMLLKGALALGGHMRMCPFMTALSISRHFFGFR